MTITKTYEADALVISVEGWLDTITAPEFHDAVQDVSGSGEVILDFEGLEYISSGGLRETVALFRRVTGNGGRFSIRHASSGVADVFRLTGFDKQMDIV